MCYGTIQLAGGNKVILELKNLSHIYMPNTAFEKTAVKDINLIINPGEFIGLIGHSGSGKSTLIQHLNGLIAPTSGAVMVDGKNIFENKEELRNIRFKIGLVFQYPEAQLFEQTVYEDIAFGPKNMGLSEEEIKERVYEAIELVGIKEELLDKSPFDLSGGQKRRVAIAGVVSMKPEILILDEPTAGLDPKGRNSILKRIKELHKKTNMSVILVSHSMEDIANNVDRIIVMNKGQLVMDDMRDNIFKKAIELERIGLSVPQITKVFMKLKDKGIQLPDDIYTVEAGKNAIIEYISKGDKL